MMHYIVKLTINDDGEPVDDGPWHLVDPAAYDACRTLCGGEAFGDGEGDARGEVRQMNRGGITCRACLDKLKEYKAVKL